MARTLIISVGTSLLGNAKRHYSGVPPTDEMLARYFEESEPKETAAETHTLFRLPLQSGDQLHWLSSDTEDGLRCARQLHAHYKTNYSSTLHEIKDLGHVEDASVRLFQSGLKNLALEAVAILQRNGVNGAKKDARGKQFVICATGGFKPEAAYLNVVGFLLNIPVVYLHELSTYIITLPQPPIDLRDADEVTEYLKRLDIEAPAAGTL